jgi:hypothetical protein
MRAPSIPILLVLAACGGSNANTATTPRTSSPQAVTAFMRAAADSNITRMAQLWGTSKGPVSQAPVPNYEKRLAVLQAYLHGDSTHVVSDMPVQGDANHRQVIVALYRGTCVKQIPVTTVRIKEGTWIVEQVNVVAAGNPARPCEGGSH